VRALQLKVGNDTLIAEICETSDEKVRGLQTHPELNEAQAMLFPFGYDESNPLSGPVSTHAFHMGSVSFPIDIVWLVNGKATAVKTVLPGDKQTYTGTANSVLELRGNWCKDRGLGVGMEVSVFVPQRNASKRSGQVRDSYPNIELNPDQKETEQFAVEAGADKPNWCEHHKQNHRSGTTCPFAGGGAKESKPSESISEDGKRSVGLSDAKLAEVDSAIDALPCIDEEDAQSFPNPDPQLYADARAVFKQPGEMRIFGLKPSDVKRAKTLEVSLDKLIPSQSFIPKQGLKAYSRRAPTEEPLVVRFQGKYYLQTGHTRLGAAILRGDQTAKVKVLDFDGKYFDSPRTAEKEAGSSWNPLRSIVEANDEEEELLSHQVLEKAAYRKLAQQFIQIQLPMTAARSFVSLLDLYDRKAGSSTINSAWLDALPTLSFWDRDAVVHSLVSAGFEQATDLLRVAQLNEELVITDKRTPGAVSHTQPQDRFQEHQIPADTPGVGTNHPGPEQTIGYDVSRDPLLDGRVPPIRMSAQLVVEAGADKANWCEKHQQNHRKGTNCPFMSGSESKDQPQMMPKPPKSKAGMPTPEDRVTAQQLDDAIRDAESDEELDQAKADYESAFPTGQRVYADGMGAGRIVDYSGAGPIVEWDSEPGESSTVGYGNGLIAIEDSPEPKSQQKKNQVSPEVLSLSDSIGSIVKSSYGKRLNSPAAQRALVKQVAGKDPALVEKALRHYMFANAPKLTQYERAGWEGLIDSQMKKWAPILAGGQPEAAYVEPDFGPESPNEAQNRRTALNGVQYQSPGVNIPSLLEKIQNQTKPGELSHDDLSPEESKAIDHCIENGLVRQDLNGALYLKTWGKRTLDESIPKKASKADLIEFGPPNEWSGAVAGILGPERRKALEAEWNALSKDEKRKIQEEFSKNFDFNFDVTAVVANHGPGDSDGCDLDEELSPLEKKKISDELKYEWEDLSPLEKKKISDELKYEGAKREPKFASNQTVDQLKEYAKQRGLQPGDPNSYLELEVLKQSGVHSSQWDPLIRETLGAGNPDLLPLTASGGGDLNPGDRFSVTEDCDGLEQGAKGVVMQVQDKSVKIKLDGDDNTRWVKKDLLNQDKDKESVLKEIEQGDEGGGDGGGLAALMGG
jgi:uncharacterized membrane protein (UPF0127 family)